MTKHFVLQELIEESKDGEWGKGEPFDGSVEMVVVRTTDFEDVQCGRPASVPVRFIPPTIAARKTLRQNDIIIETAGGGKDRPTGRTQLLRQWFCARSPLPITCASFCRFIRIDSNKAAPVYVYWLLQHLYAAGFMKQFHTQHTGVARFQYTTFATTQKFTLPLVSTQRKIAAILSAYDDLIENNTRRIAILEEMAQAIYREWFVHFRFPGHENVKLINSPLGKIPEGWKVLRLENICERITSGGTPRTNIAEYWGGGIPWLSSGETGNRFIIGTEKTITEEGVSKSSTRLARSGCTVIASAGQGKTRGQTSLLRLDCFINQSIIALTADGKLTTDNFLFFDLLRRYNQFRQISDGSSRGSLTTKLLADLEVIVPTPELVRQYDLLVESMVCNIELMLRKNDNLRITRDLLLPKLISGQLDVEELDIETGEPLVEAVA